MTLILGAAAQGEAAEARCQAGQSLLLFTLLFLLGLQ